MDETKDNRKYIADWENRTTIAWRFHNQYPEINIDSILDGLKQESDVIHGVAKVAPEEKKEAMKAIIEIVKEEAVEEVSEKDKQIEILEAELDKLYKQ